MSFGFGVGDILAVTELAIKIRKRFADAPAKLQEISYEVKSLFVVLSDVEVYRHTVVDKLHPSKAEELKTIIEGSKLVLQDLDGLLTKYENSGPISRGGERHRVKQMWERLMFDHGDIHELRARLTSNVSLLEAFITSIAERQTQKSLARLEKHIDKQEQQQILDWVSRDCQRQTDSLNYLLNCREPGTRKWLFESPQWETWISDEGRGTTFFCPGIPGAGKTHASAMVLERLYSIFPSANVGIAFTFCDYRQSGDKEHIGLARNLLRMILERPHAWPVELRPLHKSSSRSRSEVSLDEVFALLRISMRMRARNFVIIDAIDELHPDARKALVPRLFELQRCTGLSLFVTSRDIGEINDLFSNAMQTRIKATGEDIDKYISTHMTTLPKFVLKNTDLQKHIKNAIVQSAGEMFLLADLHLCSLKEKTSPKALRNALQGLCSGPNSTHDALEGTMQRVIKQSKDLANMALQTLMILTTARRPLTANELCCALAIDLDELDDGFDEDNIPDIDCVLSSCAGMVVCETQTLPIRQSRLDNISDNTSPSTPGQTGNSLVKLAHKSIQDYLSFTQSKWFPHAEPRMAAICRIFLQEWKQDKIQRETPFLNYASDHWGYHHVVKDSVTPNKATDTEIDVQIPRQNSFPLIVKQAGDHFGIRQLALELEDQGVTLLFWACEENNINVLEIFLSLIPESFTKPIPQVRRIGDVDKECESPWCPVHGGAHLDIYPGCGDLVPAACTSALRETRMIDVAMLIAATCDRHLIAEILLSHGAAFTHRDMDGFTALGIAAWKGHSNMLSWILGQDSVEVNMILAVQTRLIFVGGDRCRNWSLKRTRLYPTSIAPRARKSLRSIPEEESQGRVAVTPIAGAALNGHEECVRIILEWVGKQCPESTPAEWATICMNAMICAIEQGHLTIMRMLLPLIDVNSAAPGFNGYTPLHFAVLTQNIESVKILTTDARLDPNIEGTDGRTPLDLAARMGSQEVLQELWACGAAPAGPLAFVEALLEGHDTVFKILCKRFSECTTDSLVTRGDSGYSFLDRILFNYVKEMANCKAICAIQEPCISNIEDIDAYDWTPFKNTKLVPRLYYKGLGKLGTMLLDPSHHPIVEKTGQSDGQICFPVDTLFFVRATRSYPLVRSFLQFCPAASCTVDSKGRTILMAAVAKSSQLTVGIILKTLEEQENKTIVNAVSEAGDSALSLAIWDGHLKCLDSLLSFDGLDVRPLLQEDKWGEYPLMALAMMTAERSTLPLPWIESKRRRVLAGGGVLNEKCEMIFKSLLANIDSEELSNRILEFSERQFCQSGMRLTDALSQLPRPGCLQSCLQACPALRSQLLAPDANGMTSLIHASKTWVGSSTIRFLLKIPEISVGHRDAQGRTALSHVAQNMSQFFDGGLTSVLIEEYGHDPLEVDNNGWSALRYAICNGNVWEGSPYERLLRDADTPMNWTDEHGSTPFHLVIKGGSPLAIKLLLQHSSSSSWLNTADAEGLVPLAHFFSVSQTSKYMNNYRMRLPFSGPGRIIADIKDSLQHHHAAREAVQMMLNRPDILPDIPDNKGQTPLWHALDSVRQEYQAYSSGLGSSDNGHFHGFLKSTIEALCARDDVDPLLRPTESAKTPLELATELVQICDKENTQGSVAHSDAKPDSTPPEDADAKAKMRAVIKRLRPMLRGKDNVAKPSPPRPPRKRQP